MLTSSSFDAFIHLRYIPYIPKKWLVIHSWSLEHQPVISQTQPVHLKPTAGSSQAVHRMIWGLRFEHMLFNGDSYSKEFYTTCLLLWLGVSPHPLNYSSSSVRVGWRHLSFQALFWCSRTPDHDFLWPCHKESKVCEIYGSQLVHSSGIWQGSRHQKRHVSRWDWTMFPKHRCHLCSITSAVGTVSAERKLTCPLQASVMTESKCHICLWSWKCPQKGYIPYFESQYVFHLVFMPVFFLKHKHNCQSGRNKVGEGDHGHFQFHWRLHYILRLMSYGILCHCGSYPNDTSCE